MRDGLLKYQKYYQSLLDEKAKLIENIDKKFAIRIMEEGEEKRVELESEKKNRVEEIDVKFQEVIDMLVANYSDCV